jgi:hypothetical protein
MAWREYGNPPIASTGALVSNPSTAAMLAKTSTLAAGLYECRFLAGASTNANFFFERANSTTLGAGTVQQSFTVFTPGHQSGQYVITFKAAKDDFITVRTTAEGGGGLGANTASASIQTEVLT